MATWMKFITGSTNVAITPPAGEVWMLNSWTGFNLSGSTTLGTIDITLASTGYGLNSLGSRTTLAPAFTSSLPLYIRPNGTTNGTISGYKFSTADAPYVPVQIKSSAISVGSRLVLQPPVGKVWRIVGANTSAPDLGNVYWRVDVSTDSGSSWINAWNSPIVLSGSKGDLWSWRDKPLSIRAAAGGTYLIYVYVYEFNESDLLSSRVYGNKTSLGLLSYYDIRPPIGEEWVVDGLYYDQPCLLVSVENGTATSQEINFTYDPPGPFRIDNNTYIRVRNNNSGLANIVYLGRKIN